MKTTKKYLSLVCCAICAIATCLALVACGGGKAAKGAKMVGYWELVSGKADGTELTEDDIQMMNDWGMKVVLYLGEDGKATLDLFGEVQDSTWDIEKCTLGYDGETGTLELADDKLTFAAEETSLVFKKGDDSLADQIKTDRESEKITDMGDPDDGDDGTTSSTEAATVPIDQQQRQEDRHVHPERLLRGQRRDERQLVLHGGAARHLRHEALRLRGHRLHRRARQHPVPAGRLRRRDLRGHRFLPHQHPVTPAA